MDAIQALKRTMLFGELDEADLEALATRVVVRRLRRGEILFMAGDPASGLYVVVEGAIRAFRVSADGREQTIHVEKGGATLAEVPVSMKALILPRQQPKRTRYFCSSINATY